MNYSNLSDLYGAEPGEILLFSQDTILRDLYGEALSNNIYIDVSKHPLGHYVVQVEEKTTPTSLADMIVKSEFVNEDVFTLQVPNYINLETLRVMIYKRMKLTVLNYSIGLKGNLFFAKKKRELINKIGSVDLDNLFASLTLGSSKKLDIKNVSNLESTLTRIYSKAKEIGVTIKINVTEENIVITKISNSRNKSDSYFSRFYEWLKSIDLDVKCKIPDDFLTANEAYIKTVISKSGFDCKYSKGWVTKVSVALRRKAGKIDLCAGGQVLKTFDTARVCHLTSKDRALVNLLIKPYGKTFEDL